MTTCFVMQQFDNGGDYDTRYEESFAPAIKRAGALPVRADKILGTTPIIDKIETAIREATIAFADISENNPNVFIELGFALEIGIPLVMVCDRAKRDRLPFDIQHRPVIFYQTRSQGDFTNLAVEIERAISAALVDAKKRVHARSDTVRPFTETAVDDLKNRVLLVVLEQEIGSPTGASAYVIRSSVAKFGYSDQICSLAILGLVRDGFLSASSEQDRDGDAYSVYTLNEAGRNHMLSQYATLRQREEEWNERLGSSSGSTPHDDLDDDVPF